MATRVLSRRFFVFVLVNLLVLLASGSGYIYAAELDSFAAASFVAVALFETLGVATLVLAALTWAASRVSRLAAALVGALLFTLMHALVFIDVRLFARFRFHINGLVLNVVTAPFGLEATGISHAALVVFVTALVVVMSLEVAALWWWLGQRSSAGEPRRRRVWVIAVAVVLMASVVEHGAFVAADLLNYAPVLRATRAVPFYQWLTFKKQLREMGRLPVSDDELPQQAPSGATALQYPRAALRQHRPEQRPSILLVVLDSMRFDTLSEGVMPKLSRWARGEQYFPSCYSAGNATRFGIFGLLYGLYGSYWHAVLGERRGPVLLDRVRALGYRTAALASASLAWPEFRETAFAGGVDVLVDNLQGRTSARDQQLVGELGRFINDPAHADAPYFAFVFFDSSHSPFDYPETYGRSGGGGIFDSLGLREAATSAGEKSRYQIALTYLDELTAQLLTVARGHDPDLAHTIVIVTGDHGQEFGEHGYYGHNGAFDAEQIKVPLIVHMPGMAAALHPEAVSSLDVVPTLGAILGIENPPADYALGTSLFSSATRPNIVSCGWDRCALVDAQGVVVYGVESHTSGIFEVRDRDYRELDAKQLDPERLERLKGVMVDSGAFLR